MTFVI